MENEIITIKTIRISKKLWDKINIAFNNDEYELVFEKGNKSVKDALYLQFYPNDNNPINIKLEVQ